jgi:hypothetical protein
LILINIIFIIFKKEVIFMPEDTIEGGKPTKSEEPKEPSTSTGVGGEYVIDLHGILTKRGGNEPLSEAMKRAKENEADTQTGR